MKIFYGICGEGLGHTGRSLAVIKELSKNHTVDIFTYGQAYEYIKNEGFSRIHLIPGWKMVQAENTINVTKTLYNFAKLMAKSKRTVMEIIKEEEKPQLFITDFEPIIPRVAKRLGIPCVSIDNQHKFLLPSKGMPFVLRAYSRCAGAFIRKYIPAVDHAIITTFHECIPQEHFDSVGVIVRDDILRLLPSNRGHVLVYLKELMEEKVLSILQSIDRKFLVYGCRRMESPSSNIILKPVTNEEFSQDLASCDRIIATAGNQLAGEAKYLLKPMLVIPVKNQTEQMVNAWYLKKEGYGDYCKIGKLTREKVESFLQAFFMFPKPVNGLSQVMQVLERFL